MKSPFTGGEVIRQNVEQELEFRKEKFIINYNNYKCVDTGEEFTTREIDELNLKLLHNAYRSKHNIPFPDQITQIREQYGVNQTKMSAILGFGSNTYRNYENGDIPQLANANLIRLACEPDGFITLVNNCTDLTEVQRKKYIRKAEELSEIGFFWNTISLFKNTTPSSLTGYQIPDIYKLAAMINILCDGTNTFFTKMNKLLFYVDFSHFFKYGVSISGASYQAIPKGPVPHRYGTLYDYGAENGLYDLEIITFETGDGTKFHAKSSFDVSQYLSEEEIGTIREVKEKFGHLSTNEIIELSHQEDAWLENQESMNMIDYSYAFKLNGI